MGMTGEIKNVQEKGYGFILAENHKEYFFHYTAYSGNWDELKADVRLGKKVYVEFEEDNSQPRKGPRAMNVERLNN